MRCVKPLAIKLFQLHKMGGLLVSKMVMEVQYHWNRVDNWNYPGRPWLIYMKLARKRGAIYAI